VIDVGAHRTAHRPWRARAGKRFGVSPRRSSPLSYFTYGRLAGGNIARILRGGGKTVYYEYDLTDRLVSEVWRESDHSQVYAFLYDYDAAGNRVKEYKRGQPRRTTVVTPQTWSRASGI